MKVPISEVEEYVNQLPGIARCAGYAIVDAVTGERLAIAVMSEPGAEIDFESVVEGLRAKGLATWKLPEEIVLWDEPFPENATGKVLRTQLEAAGCGRPRLQALRLREPK
jgi:acyl-CoA synthetase (AMP-forming)/AMP-acid ligase II